MGPGCWGSPPLKFPSEPPTLSFWLDLVASDPHVVLEGLKTSGETGSNGHPRVCLKETFKPFSIGRETHREEVSELLVSETGFTKGTPWGYPPPVSSLARTCHALCCLLLFTSEKAVFPGLHGSHRGTWVRELSLLPLGSFRYSSTAFEWPRNYTRWRPFENMLPQTNMCCKLLGPLKTGFNVPSFHVRPNEV